MQYDHRGTIVLRTVKKVVHVDSADRDSLVYYTNGEFVVYLPRTYEKVVSIRLMSAEFPSLDYAFAHFYGNTTINGNVYTGYGPNFPTTVFSNDSNSSNNPLVQSANYFFVEIDGLNANDEGAVGANRSQYPNAFFAKIPAFLSTRSTNAGFSNYMIEYNDHSGQENIAHYYPPIGKLDRMRIRTRLHPQQGNTGFLYWTNATTAPTSASISAANFALTFEIEYLDNGFDDYSSFETRLRDRPTN